MAEKSFKEKVLDDNEPVIVFEAIPGHKPTAEERDIRRSAGALLLGLYGFFRFRDVDGLWIPEVIDESERGQRPAFEKVPAREYVQYIQEVGREIGWLPELIVSHVFPYMPKNETEDWLKETYYRFNIKNLIVVGPTRQRQDLPGYSVVEAGQKIAEMNSRGDIDIFAGGIWMDSRRIYRNPQLTIDEPERMARKAAEGKLEHFFGQITYDPDSTIRAIEDYSDICKERGMKPKRVFVCVSPISSKQTMDTIEGLRERDVDIALKRHLFPEDPEQRELYRGAAGTLSVKYILGVLEEVIKKCHRKDLGVPLGVCIEYITDGNHRYSHELLYDVPTQIKEFWRRHPPVKT